MFFQESECWYKWSSYYDFFKALASNYRSITIISSAINHDIIYYTETIMFFLSKAKVYDFYFSAFLLKNYFKFCS